jgi:hypothetical protein
MPNLKFQKEIIKKVEKGVFWKKLKKCFFDQKWPIKPIFPKIKVGNPVFCHVRLNFAILLKYRKTPYLVSGTTCVFLFFFGW